MNTEIRNAIHNLHNLARNHNMSIGELIEAIINEKDVSYTPNTPVYDSINDIICPTVSSAICVGDYVRYEPDILPENNIWRVWKIDENSGEVIIMPQGSLEGLYLKKCLEYGDPEFRNPIEILDTLCKKYTCERLGITKDNIRSMRIEDIEAVIDEDTLQEAKDSCNYGKIMMQFNGRFFSQYIDGKNIFYPNRRIATFEHPIQFMKSDYILEVEERAGYDPAYDIDPQLNWKDINSSKNKYDCISYGDMIDDTNWLASLCEGPDGFGMFVVNRYSVRREILYPSSEKDCNKNSFPYGLLDEYSLTNSIKPLISLSPELFGKGGDGTELFPWILCKE